MTEQNATTTCWETFKAESATAIDRVKALIREGSVRRIVVLHEGRTVAEFPLNAGVVGVVMAPVLAGLGALVALLKDCTIRVERETSEPARPAQPAQTAAR